MESTYHTYQQILDLDGEVLKQRRARRKFKKSLDGCMECKRKRKKCDEKKPSCSSCVRRGSPCEWPKHVQEELGLPDPQYQQQHQQQHQQQYQPFQEARQHVQLEFGQQQQSLSLANQQTSDPLFDLSFTDDPLLYEFLHIQSIIQEEDSESVLSHRSTSSVTSASREYEEFEHTIPGIELTREEARCYDAFVSTFLTSITPAHCDPLLSPMTLLLPYAIHSETVREIFFACGATQLAFTEDEFVVRSHQRYVKCVGLLVADIKKSSDGCEDHLFIAVQLLQTLCLRDKSLGLNATKSAGHLAASYEILKKRFLKCATDGSGMGLRLSPLDRILTEHFIFNFPITIILCRHDKLSKVPSPFSFFEQFGNMLTRPFSMPSQDSPTDEWTTHPILGVSLKSHEIATKLTWIIRTRAIPLTPEDSFRALELREQVTVELSRLSSLLNESPSNAQRQSIVYARGILFGCSIILRKLCSPETIISDLDLQKDVASMILEMEYSKQLDQEHLLSLWAMFIGGSAAIRKEHREFFTKGFESVSQIIRSSLAQKVLRYLTILWEEDENVGLEFLFDTTVLDIVCT